VTDEAMAQRAIMKQLMDALDSEELAPSAGLEVTEHRITSQPDGNQINIRLIGPSGGSGGGCWRSSNVAF
jgi:acetyl esterase